MLRNIQIQIKQSVPSTFNNVGVWVEGTRNVSTVFASVQPASADDLKRLPEGSENRDPKAVFTSVYLKSGDTVAGTSPDIVVYEGNEYEVVSVGAWKNGVIPHCRSVCLRRDA